MDATGLVNALADPSRRQVVAALLLGANDARSAQEASGLPRREVIMALSRLEQLGMVETGSDGTSVVLEAVFDRAARQVASDRRMHPGREVTENGDDHERVGDGGVNDGILPALPSAQQRELSRCFRGGRLVHLPRKHAKRRLVLDHLVQDFEPGRRYSEREVNLVLLAYTDDHVTIRRYLIDEGFLDRSQGEYWRSGGTVSVEVSC